MATFSFTRKNVYLIVTLEFKSHMVRPIIISTFFSWACTFIYAQNKINSPDDYKVYSAFLKTLEILQNTNSLFIINKTESDTSSYSWVTDAIKSNDQQQLQQIYFLSRDTNGKNIHFLLTLQHNIYFYNLLKRQGGNLSIDQPF